VSFLDRIVEERITQAVKRGEFGDLPGRGRPLSFEDEQGIPDDLRLAYKILKNGNCLPAELTERREIVRLRDLIAAVDDSGERAKRIRELNARILRLNLMNRGRLAFEVDQVPIPRTAPSLPGESE
jgi:hypothetical protein